MYQKIVIVGNLGRDPEMRYTPSGQAVTNFSVATNRRYTSSSGERVDETVWFRVSVWGRQAETCKQYLSKGRKVLVEGRLTADPQSGGPRIWTDSQGEKRASFEISAVTVQFLSGRGDEDGLGSSDSYESVSEGEDDIPF
jgi:single-strand DNA-binding protein